MSHLPVIVGFGGINSAGRTSSHHGFRRMVFESLGDSDKLEMVMGLATLTGGLRESGGKLLDGDGRECSVDSIRERYEGYALENTLLRRLNGSGFDPKGVVCNRRVVLASEGDQEISFEMSRRDLPTEIPSNWRVEMSAEAGERFRVTLRGELEVLLPDKRELLVQTGGQLPTGFDPATLYTSKNHPRGLQMAVFGATDAIRSMGIDWERVKEIVAPDQIGVYASSAMGQNDMTGTGGMMKAWSLGQRTSSKQLAMGLAQMPSDFINAYVLGNLGHTSAQVGACATLLYNLNAAVRDIQMGRRKVAVVGSSEAPLIPEVYEGYRAMSAVGEDAQIRKLDNTAPGELPDYRRACRPFSENCGFALGESAQFFILFSDDLAVELGARVFGAVGEVYINADGFKKSIASPGFGNYISMAKALGFTRSLFGERALEEGTFVSAHGTGTPQNRTTESHGLNEVAKAFHITNWPVSAIKCYVGHSLGAAAGDQLAAILGTWRFGLIPGIVTLDQIAEDVHQSHLNLSQEHILVDSGKQVAALINSKGFGGNNGTGVVLSPQATLNMLQQKHGREKMGAFRRKREAVSERAECYEREALNGHVKPIYRFGETVLDGADLDLTHQRLRIPGFAKSVNLEIDNPYPDMAV